MNSTHTIALCGPSSGASADYTLTLPALAPTIGYAMIATSTSAVTWKPAQVDYYASTNESYTVTDTDGYRTIGVTTGGTDRTLTLPTAADNTGRRLIILKLDGLNSDGTGKLTVEGEGSEQVGGADNQALYTTGDNLHIVCTGSAWVIEKMTQTEYVYNTSSSTTTSDTSSFAYGTGGQAIASITAALNRRVRFLSAVTAYSSLVVEADPNANGKWIPAAVGGSTEGVGASWNGFDATNDWGFGALVPVASSTTDFDVSWRQYRVATTNWSALTASKWRVKKITII